MWYYTLNNQQVGPVEEAEIKKLVASGVITPATMLWTSRHGQLGTHRADPACNACGEHGHCTTADGKYRPGHPGRPESG